MIRRLAAPLLVLGLAAIPALPLVGAPDRFLADPYGELPVKLWVFETFARVGLLGGTVETAGYPNVGPLNNPDPVGTLVTAALRPLVGRVWAYNLLVVGQLAASALAAWALARALLGDARAAVVAGVVYALAPLVLAYAVAGAVTDLLNLWPYPLALLGLVHALRGAAAGTTAAASPGPAAWAALAGVAGGLGFVTCPYNFVVFGAMVFPALLAAPLLLSELRALRPRRVAALALVTLVALVAVAGTHALSLRAILDDPASQMSADAVAATRHTPPYLFLEPGHRDRYVAWLADYVAVGKDALIERVAASRFYRAYAPGFLALALALVGLFASAHRRLVAYALLVALFCAVASTGPFLPVTRDLRLPGAHNPAWLLTQHVLPGGDLILEPFRYALPVGLGLGLAAAAGAHALARRFPRVVWALPALILAEGALLSPVPFPLPTTRLVAPAIYLELDRLLPPGPILELPYFDDATDRFVREHFFHQLLHRRAIPDEVIGFAPRYLRENAFTARLLAVEKFSGRLRVEPPTAEAAAAARDRLRADGFVGIVVDPTGYATEGALKSVTAQLEPFGPPTKVGDRWIYRLPPADRVAAP